MIREILAAVYARHWVAKNEIRRRRNALNHASYEAGFRRLYFSIFWDLIHLVWIFLSTYSDHKLRDSFRIWGKISVLKRD